MKVYDKGRTKRIALLLALALIFVSVPFPSYATSSTRQEIEEKEQEKDQLENQMDANEQELDGLKGEQKSLKRQLTDLNEQLTAVSDRLEELEQLIRAKEQEIADMTQALADAKAKEAWQYDCMEKRIQYAYEMGQDSLLDILSAGRVSPDSSISPYIRSAWRKRMTRCWIRLLKTGSLLSPKKSGCNRRRKSWTT